MTFKVVLGNGTIAIANLNEHSDLFWALKGGGPNFGIVTRFDLEVIPSNLVWYEILVFSPAQADEVLATLAQWQLEGGSSDTLGNVNLVISLDEIVVLLIYGAPQAQAPAAFDPFYQLVALDILVPGANGTLQDVEVLVSSTTSLIPMR